MTRSPADVRGEFAAKYMWFLCHVRFAAVLPASSAGGSPPLSPDILLIDLLASIRILAISQLFEAGGGKANGQRRSA